MKIKQDNADAIVSSAAEVNTQGGFNSVEQSKYAAKKRAEIDCLAWSGVEKTLDPTEHLLV